MELMPLFHGSPQIVAHPFYGGGRPYNDYGRGFIAPSISNWRASGAPKKATTATLTSIASMAAALRFLNSPLRNYSTLHWLALLLEHRKIDLRTPVAQAGSEFLRAHYLLDAESFDVIVGHRADDSYFTFAPRLFAKRYFFGAVDVGFASR